MARFNWRAYFSDFRHERLKADNPEEQQYQAFKARFLEEQRQEQAHIDRALDEAESSAMADALGPHGQG